MATLAHSPSWFELSCELKITKKDKIRESIIPPGFELIIGQDSPLLSDLQVCVVLNTTEENISVSDVLLAGSSPENITIKNARWTLTNIGTAKQECPLNLYVGFIRETRESISEQFRYFKNAPSITTSGEVEGL